MLDQTPDQCLSCTVQVPAGQDVCTFCANYTPPETVAQKLDVMVNKADLLRHDGNEVLRDLPTDAPLLTVADLVTALGHMRKASVLLERVADALEAVEATR